MIGKTEILKGKRHNTNGILIQQSAAVIDQNPNVSLEPDYNYDRKKHRSFKGFRTQLQPVQRTKFKQLEYEPTKDKLDYDESTRQKFATYVYLANC